MTMIIIGIIVCALGGFDIFNGVAINNDVEKQMESFFNDGKTNTGDTLIYAGIVFVIIGALLIICGTIRLNNKAKYKNQLFNNNKNLWLCLYCGTQNTGEFCIGCGTKHVIYPVNYGWTCICGNNANGEFCNRCGTKKPSAVINTYPNCGNGTAQNAESNYNT